MDIFPIEGNGWYRGDCRFDPPNNLNIEILSIDDKNFKGIIDDKNSEFNGMEIIGHKRYSDSNIYEIEIFKSGLKGNFIVQCTGYIRLGSGYITSLFEQTIV